MLIDSDIYSSLGWRSNCVSAGLSTRVDLKETGVSVNVFKTCLGVESWILVKISCQISHLWVTAALGGQDSAGGGSARAAW